MEAFYLILILAVYFLIANACTIKKTNKRVTKEVRQQLEQWMALDDGEFLRASFGDRSGWIIRNGIKRSKEHGRQSAPRNRSGYVYIARAQVRPTWYPKVCDIFRRTDPTIIRYRDRFNKASNGSIYKIGHTTRHPSERIEQLNSEPEKAYKTLYQPFTFRLSAWWKVDNCFELEIATHRRLKNKKVVGEIFHERPEIIAQHIEEAAEQEPGVCIRDRWTGIERLRGMAIPKAQVKDPTPRTEIEAGSDLACMPIGKATSIKRTPSTPSNNCVENNMTDDPVARHRKYRMQPFASKVGLDKLDPDEAELIEKYGTWMQALADSEIPPLTTAQAHFVRVANRQARPETLFEAVWMKYMQLTKLRPSRETVIQRVRANEYDAPELLQLLEGGFQLNLTDRDLDEIRAKLSEQQSSERGRIDCSVVFSTTDGQ